MTPSLADHPDVRGPLDLLAAWTEAQVAYRGWPSLAIGIVHDRALVWSRGFGFADLEAKRPATPATRYRVASITKTFTAAAILQLRDAGKLRLDDEVRTYLPWCAPKSANTGSPPITIRHLLTHTAGLPREAPFPYWMEGRFPSLEEVRAALPDQDCVLPTETRWKYSNLALVLAGEIVSAVSGVPWETYVTRHLLVPLGMRDTRVDTPATDDPTMAQPYARRLPSGERGRAPWTDTRGITAAAGLTTTVEDLARFIVLQLRTDASNASQILRASTLAEMQRIHWLEPEWQAGWGLGFHIYRSKERTLVGHGGALRGYRSDYRFSPAERFGVVVLINADDGEPRLVVEKAFEWVAPAVARATAPAPSAPDPAWQRYVGRYRNPWGDLHVLVTEGRLTMIGPALLDPAEVAATLEPIGTHTFRLESKDGFASVGEPVVFEVSPDGTAVRMKVGANTYPAVESW